MAKLLQESPVGIILSRDIQLVEQSKIIANVTNILEDLSNIISQYASECTFYVIEKHSYYKSYGRNEIDVIGIYKDYQELVENYARLRSYGKESFMFGYLRGFAISETKKYELFSNNRNNSIEQIYIDKFSSDYIFENIYSILNYECGTLSIFPLTSHDDESKILSQNVSKDITGFYQTVVPFYTYNYDKKQYLLAQYVGIDAF
jgi:hypothetical protein